MKTNLIFTTMILLFLFLTDCGSFQPTVRSGVYFRKGMKDEYNVSIVRECISTSQYVKVIINNTTVIVKENNVNIFNKTAEEKANYEGHSILLRLMHNYDAYTGYGSFLIFVFIDGNEALSGNFNVGCSRG